jgi:nicotinamide-nucleotide amidase
MRELAERHERFVFSRDGSTIDEQVAGLLRERHRIGLGESCTAGLLAARLAEPPGASQYLAGGVVAYSNEAKTELLGVPAELIAERGAVSPEVAEAMADGALARFDGDTGVGITGIAGPEGGTEEKPVGYVCVCVKLDGGPAIARDPVIPGDRIEIKDRSCTLALQLLRRLLRGEEFPL